MATNVNYEYIRKYIAVSYTHLDVYKRQLFTNPQQSLDPH